MPQATPLLLLLERLTRAVEALAQGRYQQRVPLSQAPQETSQETPQSSRGAMRQRILTLLREHPEGLSPAQTRDQLGIDRGLNNTMHAMARDGLLGRVERGRYIVA